MYIYNGTVFFDCVMGIQNAAKERNSLIKIKK